jgi:hypothetical protein
MTGVTADSVYISSVKTMTVGKRRRLQTDDAILVPTEQPIEQPIQEKAIKEAVILVG